MRRRSRQASSSLSRGERTSTGWSRRDAVAPRRIGPKPLPRRTLPSTRTSCTRRSCPPPALRSLSQRRNLDDPPEVPWFSWTPPAADPERPSNLVVMEDRVPGGNPAATDRDGRLGWVDDHVAPGVLAFPYASDGLILGAAREAEIGRGAI